jgi:Uma2 family endonuclease
MAATPLLLPIEDYLHTSYKPDVHYVDGEIEERNVGERTHSFFQGYFFLQFSLHPEWRMEAMVEQRIRINSSRVRVCDVTVIGADDPFEEVMTAPPVACIEVLSPEDRIARAEKVLADYFAMGVPNIWLIDPLRRIVYVYDKTGLHPQDPAHLHVGGTSIAIDVTQAFAELDKKLANRKRL